MGSKESNHMYTDMVIIALNQAIADRSNLKDIIHCIDIGVQSLDICYNSSMVDSGAITWVGIKGSNALAKMVNGLYESVVIKYLKNKAMG